MTRVILVHGSITDAETTWAPLLAPLRERFDVVLHTRPGYPPRPPVEHTDFEDQADEVSALLADGDHLVGHSYGGVVSLLAASRTTANIASLAVSEPPAFDVARQNPAVAEVVDPLKALLADMPESPREYLAAFLPIVGSSMPLPDPLPPPLEAGTRAAMAERPPWEAEIPLDVLARLPTPKLVMSGGHSAAFDAVCDVLTTSLAAKRITLPGAAHSIPRAPGAAEALIEFIESAT